MPPSKVTLDDEVDDLDGTSSPSLISQPIGLTRLLDVLEQFNAPPTRPAPVRPPSTSISQAAPKSTDPTSTMTIPEGIADEDAEFARQFAAEMEAFMKGLASAETLSKATNASSSSNSAATLPDPEELRKAWEKLLVEDLEADPASTLEVISDVPGSSSGKPLTSDPTAIEDTFQTAVKQAMEKLRESDDTIKVQTDPL
jgi:peroxin-19